MAQVFDDTKITSFQPKQEKNRETKEFFNKMIFRGETKLDNSLQITELFAGFRKQLVTVKFTPHDSFDTELTLVDVNIEDFTVKTKMETIGKGKEAERIPVECVYFKMAVLMDEHGDHLKNMYAIFNRSVKMEIE
ncbi:hypothetical protein JXB12_08830 [candidate division KSB1 bacterium]|nr:hypothetical protein [candidate division KSB1 bacterium]